MDAIQTLLPYREHSDVSADPELARRRAEVASDASEDNLLAARGVLISVVIGAGLWAVILTAGWLIFR
jgi:hypothetical protein